MNILLPVAKEPYKKHIFKIEKATERCGQGITREDFDRHLDDIEMDGEEMIANVSVTVDGTSQKRGHSSKIGVVFIISVEMVKFSTMKSLFS